MGRGTWGGEEREGMGGREGRVNGFALAQCPPSVVWKPRSKVPNMLTFLRFFEN